MENLIKKWVKITLLNWEEEELQQIQGRCTNGSVSIDGNAAVRRTCSLTMVVDKPQEIDASWAISKKIKVSIGVETFNQYYKKVKKWYNQGIFVITSFSANETANAYTISLSAQDKMCLLNGTCGGTLFAETDFGNISTYKTIKAPDGDISTFEEKKELSIFDIIRESVHEFGGERYENIFIKDIEDALELIEYRGSGTLLHTQDDGVENLVEINLNNDEVLNKKFQRIYDYGFLYEKVPGSNSYFYIYTFSPDITNYIIRVPRSSNEVSDMSVSNIVAKAFNVEYSFTKEDFDKYLNFQFKYLQELYGVLYTRDTNGVYSVASEMPRSELYYLQGNNAIYQYGDVIGYRPTALTYSETDFILKPGESVGTLLEKITTKFGLYEYFYDIDGKFVFQKKRTYINFQYNGILNKNNNNFEYIEDNREYLAQYNDKKQIVSINSTPQLQNIKNDYSIWGTTSDKVPFHVRIGVNRKPTKYVSYKGVKYTTQDEASERYELVALEQLPWLLVSSELFYRDVDNNYVPFTISNIFASGEALNEDSGMSFIEKSVWTLLLIVGINLLDYGIVASQVALYKKAQQKIDYRELIYQMALDYYTYHQEKDFYAVIQHYNPWAKNGRTGYETFYADMKEFWPHLYKGNITKEDFDKYILAGDKKGWSKDILEPSSLIFWFELIDGNEEYWIENIGSRMKSETNSSITAIAYKDIPNFLFMMTGDGTPDEWLASNKNIGKFGSGYTSINVPVALANDFVISAKHYSAMELAEQYIYSYTNLAETKNVSIIPNYSLEPNCKIKLLGESYAIKSISVPLSYNGLMNLTLTKIYD